MATFQQLIAELAITIANRDVWLAIGLALLLGGLCLAFGIWVTRLVGLLQADAPAGEVIGVGLGAGLMVVAAWWAAIWSGGRSSFTPVAIGFAIAIALAVARRARGLNVTPPDATDDPDQVQGPSGPRRSVILAVAYGAAFVVAVALLYGSTLALSPRDGRQPVENRDVAFYAVLGRDLATTGIETNLSPSGFSDLPGFPVQTWYHWGELWLASAVISILGTTPLAARYFVVLPLVVLAAAALTGTVVRRMSGTRSSIAYLFGFGACLFLAPIPVISGPFFSSWAVGMIFGATLYGLGAVAGLFGVYSLLVLGDRRGTWALATFVASLFAFILPAHLALAALAVVGVGMLAAAKVIRAAQARRLPILPVVWVRTILATSIAVVSTVTWGIATGHGMGSSASSTGPPNISPSVVPFNASWGESVAITVLGAGLFLAIPVAWFLHRRDSPGRSDLYFATIGILVVGAIGWGAQLADYTMFYLYFAGIAVFAMTIAPVAVRALWERLRATRHRWLAVGLVLVCLFQLELGVVSGIVRLQGFGPSEGQSISSSLLGEIGQLPPDAKLAYSCGPFDEVAFGTPQLLSIDAHTARRVVPMCFEAEFPNTLLGAERSDQVPSQFFRGAPQMALYPDAAAHPSREAVAEFLRHHRIQYVFADLQHPNTLIEGAELIAADGGVEVLSIP